MCILSKWLSVRVFTVLSMVVQWLHFKPRRSRSKCKSSSDVAGTAKKTHAQEMASGFSFQCIFKLFYLFLAAMGLRCVCGFLWLWRRRLLSSCGARVSFFSCCGSQALRLRGWWPLGLFAPGHMGSYFPDQGSSLCPLRWQAGGSVLTGEFSTAGQPGEVPGVFFCLRRHCCFLRHKTGM